MRPEALCLCCAVLITAATARGVVLSEDPLEDESTEVGIIARDFNFVLAGDLLQPPYTAEDASPAAIDVLALRGYFSYHTPSLRLVLHQSTLSTVRSSASLGFLSLGRATTPPRWLPLRAVATDDPTLSILTQTDWGYAAFTEGPLTLTVGRQPVTVGRGRLFQPWDLVSRFALTQVDRSYKPGVDAARIDATLPGGISLMGVAAVGELAQDGDLQVTGRGSSFLGRAKVGGDIGELALLGGVIRNDVVFGWSALWTLSQLDLYGELSATVVRSSSLSSPAVQGRGAPVLRGLLGAEWHPVDELTIVPEAYTTGFGAARPSGYLPVLASGRVGVGEQTVLGKLYGAVAADWEIDPLFHVTAASMSNVLDPSALVSLGATYDVAANAKILVGGYLPVGPGPTTTAAGPVARSEFGLYPYFGFAELTLVL